jgi:pullulanase/glycogen debranching enzyme
MQGLADVEWRHRMGDLMEPADWTNPRSRALVLLLRPSDASGGAAGEIAVACNAGDGPVDVHWPAARDGFAWHCCIDTAHADRNAGSAEVEAVDTTASAHARSSSSCKRRNRCPRRASGCRRTCSMRWRAAAGIAPDWWDVAGSAAYRQR